ncbi:MAG: TrkA family potassium uptake protein [Acholeplasmataceae bacterium]|nr:TrkA family potassium uptake protein [Acholeplasmataceae bacterium]
MKKTVAVIGIGRFGLNLIESFSKNNVDVLALDYDEQRLKKAVPFTESLIVCDSTDEDALKEAGIKDVDRVIIAFGQSEKENIATTIVTTIKLKQLGIENITVRVDDESFENTIKLIGAKDIIYPLKIASDKIANRISSDSVIDYYNLTDEFDAYEIQLTKNFKKLPIIDLNTRTNYFINILIVERNNKFYLPNKDTILLSEDKLIIFGRKKDINKIIRFFENYV